MPFNETITWDEFEGLGEQPSAAMYKAIRGAEERYAKLASIGKKSGGGTYTNAEIATKYFPDLNETPFATQADLEAAIGFVRDVATTLNTITSGVTQPQLDDLMVFV